MQMLNLKYTNHYGETLEFGKDGLYINESDIHDYEWEYSIVNNKIKNFKSSEKKPKLQVFATGENRKEIANRLFEIIEKDVLENEVGFITIGDYYLEGYFVSKENSKYKSGKIIEMNLTFVATNRWMRKTKYSFIPEEEPQHEGDLDFPYDFPHDFKGTKPNQNVINSGFMPCDFELIFYGSAITPTVVINGHEYQVFESLNEGEYLVVNSLSKKIYKVLNDGTIENVFNKRNKESYIFEKIAVGKATIVRDVDSRLDITLIEQRSEPKWI